MTTIAYNRGVIACDRQGCDGGLITRLSCKAVKYGNTVYLGAGTLTRSLKFISWLQEGGYDQEDIKPPELKDTVVIEFDLKTGKVIEWHAEWPLDIEDSVYAWGSGSHLAIGAMSMGADVRKAIEVASKWDSGTGLGVQVFVSEVAQKRIDTLKKHVD